MTTYKVRSGQMIEADEAFHAWTTRDVGRMQRALNTPTHPVDRHHLLRALADAWYSLRAEPAARARFLEVTGMHRAEFPVLFPAIVSELRGVVPRVPFFANLATVLVEDGRFDEAVAVCSEAIAYGLQDGTKTGFPGRIARIRRKQAKSAQGAA